MQVSVNTSCRLSVEIVGIEKIPIIIIDDWICHPEKLVEYAADEKCHWHDPHTVYPGRWAETPETYFAYLYQTIKPLLAKCYGVVADKPQTGSSRFALSTRLPEQLKLQQRLPHVDDVNHMMFACVHYLCGSPHSGTAIYRHKSTGFETLSERRWAEYMKAVNAEINAQGEPEAAYCNDSNSMYEKIFESPAVFNRLIVYPSFLLHSAVIRGKESLSLDPLKGRLTTTSFMQF